MDIQTELFKINNYERFKAVVIYVAGIFSSNQTINFLNTCKQNLCDNFLDLLGNQEHKKIIQDVLRSILKHPFESNDTSNFNLLIKSGLEAAEHSLDKEDISLLQEAANAAGESKVELNLKKVTLNNIFSFEDNDLVAMKTLFELLPEELENLRLVDTSLKISNCFMRRILRKYSPKKWEFQNSDTSQGEVIVGGHQSDIIDFGSVECQSSEALKNVCDVLGAMKVWTLDHLNLNVRLNEEMFLSEELSEDSWSKLARKAGKGRVDKVTVTAGAVRKAGEDDLRAVWEVTNTEWILAGREVKIATKSEGNEAFQMILEFKQDMTEYIWTLDHLNLSKEISENSWANLAREAGKGRVEKVTVTEEAVWGAREDDLRAVWEATNTEWILGRWEKKNARKSDGNEAFQMIIEFWIEHTTYEENEMDYENIEPSGSEYEGEEKHVKAIEEAGQEDTILQKEHTKTSLNKKQEFAIKGDDTLDTKENRHTYGPSESAQWIQESMTFCQGLVESNKKFTLTVSESQFHFDNQHPDKCSCLEKSPGQTRRQGDTSKEDKTARFPEQGRDQNLGLFVPMTEEEENGEERTGCCPVC